MATQIDEKYTEDIIEKIQEIKNITGQNLYNIYRDTINLSLYTLQNNDTKYLEIIEDYQNTYGKEKTQKIIKTHSEILAEIISNHQIIEQKAKKTIQKAQTKNNNTKPNDIDPKTLENQEIISAEILGAIYEKLKINAETHFQQYFTPEPIATTMSLIQLQTKNQDTDPTKSLKIADPTCGSGRLILPIARIHKYGHIDQNYTPNRYYLADKDQLLCKISTLNMALSGLHAKIVHQDSLEMKPYKAWKTDPTKETIKNILQNNQKQPQDTIIQEIPKQKIQHINP